MSKATGGTSSKDKKPIETRAGHSPKILLAPKKLAAVNNLSNKAESTIAGSKRSPLLKKPQVGAQSLSSSTKVENSIKKSLSKQQKIDEDGLDLEEKKSNAKPQSAEKRLGSMSINENTHITDSALAKTSLSIRPNSAANKKSANKVDEEIKRPESGSKMSYEQENLVEKKQSLSNVKNTHIYSLLNIVLLYFNLNKTMIF
jgi:hypothetical protein